MAEFYPSATAGSHLPAGQASPAGTGYPNLAGGAANYPSGTINFASLVTSKTVLASYQSNMGITVGTGVSAWADQTVNANHMVQAGGTAQPTYNATGLNGQPTLTFDGVNDILTCAAFNLPAPGTTPTLIFCVMRQISWTANLFVYGTNVALSGHGMTQAGASPGMQESGAAGANLNNAGTIGSWFLTEAYHSNSVSDRLRVGSTSVTGANTGNNASTGRSLGGKNASAFSNIEVAMLMYVNGDLTGGELTAIRAAVTSVYGAGVGV